MSATALYNEVLHDLGMEIVAGQLPPGSRLTLSDIEGRYAVSRTLARDVIKTVESLGLAATRRRAGIVIQPRTAWLVLDPLVIAWRLESDDRLAQIASLTDVREAIEPTAARLAAKNATREQAERLGDLASTMLSLARRGLGRADEYLTADIDYHSLLLEASSNEMLHAMRGMVADVLRGRAVHGLHPAWPDLSAVETHLHIARAVQEGDAEGAERASRHQLRLVHTELGVP